MADREIEIPAGGLQFAAPIQLAAPGQAAGPRRFSGTAYGGGVITDHPYWDAVAFDLGSLKALAPMPLLLQHDPDRVIGVIDTVTNTGAALEIGGKLFTDTEPAAAGVAAKADAGMPWQMSVGLWPDLIEEVQAGAEVNGRYVERATKVMRGARVRETSFVALGADSTTRATVFNQVSGAVTARITFSTPASTQGDASMADTNQAAEQVAALTAERDAFKAELEQTKTALSELQAQFAARQKAERETAVKALLGEEFSAEKAAPFMAMDATAFAAVQATVGGLKARLPASFTSEQASGGQSDTPITPEAITQYRRDHPGATFEQAFAALKSPAGFSAPAHF